MPATLEPDGWGYEMAVCILAASSLSRHPRHPTSSTTGYTHKHRVPLPAPLAVTQNSIRQTTPTPILIILEAGALEKELGAQLELAEGVFPIEGRVMIKTSHSLTEPIMT